MKPGHDFIAARAAANHCPQLVKRSASPGELLGALTVLAELLRSSLGGALAPLCGGTAPKLVADPPRAVGAADLQAAAGQLAANHLFALGQTRVPVLVSHSAATVFALLDRAFGGSGAVPVPLPPAFPPSAEILAGRSAAAVAAALGEAVTGEAQDCALQRSHGQLARLDPFSADLPLAAVTLREGNGPATGWEMTLALPLAFLASLDRPAAAPRRSAADPRALPFAEVPLAVRAVLAEARFPLALLAGLAPGTVLPVAVARRIPLRIGAQTIAHGTVGSQDDRTALCIVGAAA